MAGLARRLAPAAALQRAPLGAPSASRRAPSRPLLNPPPHPQAGELEYATKYYAAILARATGKDLATCQKAYLDRCGVLAAAARFFMGGGGGSGGVAAGADLASEGPRRRPRCGRISGPPPCRSAPNPR